MSSGTSPKKSTSDQQRQQQAPDRHSSIEMAKVAENGKSFRSGRGLCPWHGPRLLPSLRPASGVTSLAAMRLLTVVNVYMAASTTTALLVPYAGPMSVRLHVRATIARYNLRA
ncbi:MAG: hypothetical protein ACPIOQ_22610, partial [Promethearchaeia archaeon]